MKIRNCLAVVVLLSLLAVSCKQDNIFFTIATETAPNEKPRIEGTPTNMVVFYRGTVPIMYAAGERLHWYTKAAGSIFPGWDSPEYFIPQPLGKITSLAATENRLYALCRISNTQYLVQYIESNGIQWIPILSEAANYPFIHSIYADPESRQLFAGASILSSIPTYAILYLNNDTNTLKVLKERYSDPDRAFPALLSGAVCRDEGGEDIYYLSTRIFRPIDKGGIFRISDSDLYTDISKLEQLGGSETFNFMSMIKLKDTGNTIIAAERNRGTLFEISKNTKSFLPLVYPNGMQIIMDNYATRALALWENPGRKLLVAGIQGGLYSTTSSSHTYGYVEFELDPIDGSFNTNAPLHVPGSLWSVDDQDRYRASIGKLPINHLFQAPPEVDSEMTFFASTHTKGLWSYRNRPDNGGWQWNAEE